MAIQADMQHKPVSHVIFDLDGTIIDTVSAYLEALSNVTAKFGKCVTDEMMPTILNAQNAVVGIKELITNLDIEATDADFIREYDLYLNEALSRVKLMPGVLRLLDHLRNNHVPIGLCTAVSRNRFKLKTEHLNNSYNLYNYFEVIVTAKGDPEVKANKPSPDPYLITMNRFNICPKPEEVLVFEDTIAGIKSATSAGAQCVMIHDRRRYYNKPSLVPMVINSWSDFKPELFDLPKYENLIYSTRF